MGQKFLDWRVRNNYSGLISVPEVCHFLQEAILDTKDIMKNAKP